MLNRTGPARQYGTVQTVQKTVRGTTTRNTANYMNVKIHDPDLEERFRTYCQASDRSMNSVMNEAISGFFSVSPNTENSIDIGERFKTMVAISQNIDFHECEELLDIVRRDTISQNARLSDLVLSALAEGLANLKARYETS